MNVWTDEKKRWVLVKIDSIEAETLEKACQDAQKTGGQMAVAVAYGETVSGCKFSVVSATEEIRAEELAQYLCKGVGASGGNPNTAGGFLSECLLLAEEGTNDYEKYFQKKLLCYSQEFHIIRSSIYQAKLDQMHKYRKKQLRIGVADTTDFLKEGTPILVRTLEGDLECVSGPDLFIMVGIDGEVYPIRKEKFNHSYEFTEGTPEVIGQQEPTVYNRITGEAYGLLPFLRTCRAKESCIYAKELLESAKVFTQWDPYKYLRGEKGDFVAVREDDLSDVYTIERSIFFRSYERCE